MIIELKEDEKRELERSIYDMVEAAETQKGSASEWWAQVEKFYRNEKPEPPGKGIEPIHIAQLQPRIDTLGAQICTTVGKQSPIMVSDHKDPALADKKNRILDLLWTKAAFDAQIRKGAMHTGCLNTGIFRMVPKLGHSDGSAGQSAPNLTGAPGVAFDIPHPSDFVIYPAGSGGIDSCQLCGHRTYARAKTIEAKMLAGEYYQEDVAAGDAPDENDDTGRYAHSGTNLGDAIDSSTGLVELFDVNVRLERGGEPERWYRATLIYKTQRLIALEELPTSRPIYFDSFYIPKPTQFWGSQSVGRNLVGSQDLYNKLASGLYTGAMTTAKPVVIGPKLEDTKYKQWQWGDYIQTDEQATPWSPSMTFDGGYLINMMQGLERTMDQIARVSQNTMGTVSGRSTTATTDSIVAAGVQTGIEEYITNFSSPFPAMAEMTFEFLVNIEGLFEACKEYYGEAWDITIEECQAYCSWEPNGKTANATPQAKYLAARELLELTQDPEMGIDKYAVAKVIVTNSALSGTDGVQLSKEEVMEQMQTIETMKAIAQEASKLVIANQLAAAQPPGDSGMVPVEDGLGLPGMAGAGI